MLNTIPESFIDAEEQASLESDTSTLAMPVPVSAALGTYSCREIRLLNQCPDNEIVRKFNEMKFKRLNPIKFVYQGNYQINKINSCEIIAIVQTKLGEQVNKLEKIFELDYDCYLPLNPQQFKKLSSKLRIYVILLAAGKYIKVSGDNDQYIEFASCLTYSNNDNDVYATILAETFLNLEFEINQDKFRYMPIDEYSNLAIYSLNLPADSIQLAEAILQEILQYNRPNSYDVKIEKYIPTIIMWDNLNHIISQFGTLNLCNNDYVKCYFLIQLDVDKLPQERLPPNHPYYPLVKLKCISNLRTCTICQSRYHRRGICPKASDEDKRWKFDVQEEKPN